MNVTAIARPSGKWWAVSVAQMPGVFTQARRLDEVTEMTVDAVRTMEEDPALEVNVDVEVHVSQDVDELSGLARRERLQAEEARKKASARMDQAAKALREANLSMRDTAFVLDISTQRVSQIVNS